MGDDSDAEFECSVCGETFGSEADRDDYLRTHPD